MLAKIAWRNLWRSRRRTLITLVSIALGVWLLGIMMGTSDYWYAEAIDGGAKLANGHVTIESAGYLANPALDKTIAPVGELVRTAEAFDGVEQTTARINGQAMLATADATVGGSFQAIDPATEPPEFNIFLSSIIEGAVFDDASARKIVVGSAMADRLHVRLGSKIVLTMSDKTGEITSILLRVCGIFRTNVKEVDSYFCVVPLKTMAAALDYGPDEGGQIAVFLDDNRRAKDVAARLQAKIGRDDIEVEPWQLTIPEMAGTVSWDKAGNYIFQFIFVALVAAGILNTLLMSVMERVREFGVLLAIGMAPRRLFGMVVWEAFWLGVFGIVVGVVLTSPFVFYLYTYGWDLTQYMSDGMDIGGVLVDPVMYFRIYPEHAAWVLGMVFGLTMLAGLYPAWRAMRVAPVEAIKTD